MRLTKASLKIILPIIAISVTALITGLLIATKSAPKNTPPEEKNWQVRAVEADLATHTPLQPLLGKVVSPSQVVLAAAIEADVLRVHGQEGQTIKRGDELLLLDDREASRRLMQRQGELDEIEALIMAEQVRHENDKASLQDEQILLDLSDKSVDRLRKLAQKDLGAQAQLDEVVQAQARQRLTVQNRRYLIDEHGSRLKQLKAREKQAAARLALAKLEQARTRIVAPFDGRIMSRHVAPGQRVKNGEPLLTLYDTQQVEIVAQLPWSRYKQLSETMAKAATLAAQVEMDGRLVALKLNRIAAQVDGSKGGIDIFFSVDEGKESMQIGRVLNINLRLPEVDKSLVLPYEALYGLNKVYRIVDERLQAVDVQVMGDAQPIDNHRYVVVQSATLAQGDRVLVTKFANAMAGLRVQVLP